MSRSASETQKGYMYQDIIMLHFLIRGLNSITDVLAESPEDITVHRKKQGTSYVQVKYVKNVSYPYRSDKLRQAMGTLLEDLQNNLHTNIKDLIYVTNSHYPFAKQYDLDLATPAHAFYLKNDCPKPVQKKIKKSAETVSKNNNNKFKKILPKFLNKFGILKYYFEGSNKSTWLNCFYNNDVNYFISQTGLDKTYKYDLENRWLVMAKKADCGIRNQSIKYGYAFPKCITNEYFVSSTSVPIMLRSGNINAFVKDLGIDTPYKHFLKKVYDQIRLFFIANFTLRSLVENEYNTFIAKHLLERNLKSKKLFLNNKALIKSLSAKIFKDNEFTNTRIVTEYLSWVVLNEDDLIEGIIKFSRKK